MITSDQPPDPDPAQGALSPAEGEGTPAAVDVSRDRQVRQIWAMFVAGPVIWFSHFMLVYLVAEAGCTGTGPGLRVLAPPVPVVLTLVSTGIAFVACGAAAMWSFRAWRAEQRGRGAADDGRDISGDLDDDARWGTVTFVGFLLAVFSTLAVLFTGAPALVLGPC